MAVDTTTLDGAMVRCRGCGRGFGVTCVAFEEGYVYVAPTFPFAEDDCPICFLNDLLPPFNNEVVQLDLVLNDLSEAVGKTSDAATIRAYKRLSTLLREGRPSSG